MDSATPPTRRPVSRITLLSFFIAPVILGTAGYFARPHFMTPICHNVPGTCTVDTINGFDRSFLVSRNRTAEQLSTDIQNGVALAVAAFTVTVGLRWRRRRIPRDLAAFFAITLWNAAINEWVRLGVQRIRPYFYLARKIRGVSLQDYTSFYSGHTSFVALSCAFVFWLTAETVSPRLRAKQRPWVLGLVGTIGIALTVATGILRVMGGMHFATDVMFGAAAGVAICSTSIWILKTRFRFFEL